MIMANISTAPLPSQNDGCGSTQTYSHREKDDNYHWVIVRLAPRWRVIVCRDAVQWIIQYRTADPLHRGVWRGRVYVTTKDSLIRSCARLESLSDPSVTAILSVLPDRIGGEA